jgi:acetylornithine/succinyldiaminopimelate/putrescine aminotransferase
MKAAVTEKTCAVMLEPIQGEGGVNLPADGYLKAVQELCKQNGLLLILDEIQTGIGRTGSLFAYEQYGVEPDIMTLAKGLGSGIPIGAILAKEEASVFAPGEHGSTFGGNPAVCGYLAAGLNNLKDKFGFIKEVRGRGLLLAMEFDDDIAQELTLACLQNGLLINILKNNAVRFMPPLIVGKGEIDRALPILDKALGNIKQAQR